MFCLQESQISFYEDGEAVKCNCPFECIMNNYELAMSLNKFSFAFLKMFKANLNLSMEDISANYVMVNIYISDLIRQVMFEKQAYNWLALLSDVGGSFGLALGATILTVFEILDFIVILVLKFFERSTSRKDSQSTTFSETPDDL